jgi:MFS family permease
MVLGPIARPDLRQIVTPLVGMGTAFGLLAIAVPGMLGAGGDIEASGFVLAAISAGGIAGGLAYGALKLEGTLWRRQALLSVAFAVPILPVLFIRSPILLAVALAVAGLSVTPLYVNSYLLIDEVVSADVKQEASSWVPVGNEVGYIAGITAGGLLVWWGGFVPALTGVSIVGAVLVLVAARGLRPRRAPEPTVQPDAGQEAGRKAGREAVA